MIDINTKEFIDNLCLTQEYCRLQMQGSTKNNVEILRSYNPYYKGFKLFDFKINHFEFNIAPGVNHCPSAKWSADPTEDKAVVNIVFKNQLLFKRKQFFDFNNNLHSGKIVISQIDCIIPDGTSEAESLGLIDFYDIPPIDTWFYIDGSKWGRLLFAWIPLKFVHDTNEAIAVNMLDCIGWFDVMLPEEYKYLKPLLRKVVGNKIE